jgi:hypothetical protein
VSSPEFALFLRPGHPDFLDLPWERPLEEWVGHPRLVEVPRGLSRHPVLFVNYDGALYALKELPGDVAKKEYDLLRQMEELRLPAVVPVGHARTDTPQAEASVLLSRYLDYSLPYQTLFTSTTLSSYRAYLLDALAGLLLQLHLAGVFWGDCSLSNALFRRDAGTLQAYLVDAETSAIHPTLSDGQRAYDLEIMEENVYGALADLAAMDALPPGFPVGEIGDDIRARYQNLWQEITGEEIVAPGEHYRIQGRIRALNALGFSVDEVELRPTETGEQLRLRAFVADRNFHRDLLHSLTGLEAEELQARLMVNEIQERKATLARTHNRSTPLSVAAHSWLTELYLPMIEPLKPLLDEQTHPAELYCQVLEHKWYLSEQAQHDVGHRTALEDYLRHFGKETVEQRVQEEG